MNVGHGREINFYGVFSLWNASEYEKIFFELSHFYDR